MAVDGYYLLNQIQYRHWIKQASQTGLEIEIAQQIIEEVLQITDFVLNNVNQQIPSNFPNDLVESIFNGIRKQTKKLAQSIN